MPGGNYQGCLIVGGLQSVQNNGGYPGTPGSASAKPTNNITTCVSFGTSNTFYANDRQVSHKTLIGLGLYYAAGNHTHTSYYPQLICGKYNDDTAASKEAYFIVGGGTSGTTGNRANCFAAGNNSTDGNYIYIGDTKLTETQLQALLATL